MNDIPDIERRTKDRRYHRPGHLVPGAAQGTPRARDERGTAHFSHGEAAEHAAVLAGIRTLNEELDVPAAILQDLAGPKVRIGTPAHGSVELEPGRQFTLTTRPVEGSRDRVSVSYARLPPEVSVGVLKGAPGSFDLSPP